MNRTDQRLGTGCGVIFVVLFGTALLVAGFVPPPAPDISAEQAAALYSDHSMRIRIGMTIAMLGAAFSVPFAAAISALLLRIPQISRATVYSQLGVGAAGSLVLMLPAILLAAISFRPERDPQLTLMLHDLGWLLFVTPFPFAVVQCLIIGYAVLADRSARPVLPRWVGFFNLWLGALLTPGGIAFFFRSGSFAWNGLFPFWLPAVAFFGWFLVMAVVMLRAIKTSERV